MDESLSFSTQQQSDFKHHDNFISHINNLSFFLFCPSVFFHQVSQFLLFSYPQLAPAALQCACGAHFIPRGGQVVRCNFPSDHRGEPVAGIPAAIRKAQMNYHYSSMVNPSRGLRKKLLIYIFCQKSSQILLELLMSYFTPKPNRHNVGGYEYPWWGCYPSAKRKSEKTLLVSFYQHFLVVKMMLWIEAGSSSEQKHWWEGFLTATKNVLQKYSPEKSLWYAQSVQKVYFRS